MSDWTDNKKFNGLVKRACRIAMEQSEVQGTLTTAFEARYGKTYSEVDCDWLIDSLDYGGGMLSVAECDARMADCGAPLLSSTEAQGETE